MFLLLFCNKGLIISHFDSLISFRVSIFQVLTEKFGWKDF